MTAWIGETRWLITPPPWEAQASCLPRESRALLVRGQGVPARVCSAPARGAEEGAGSLDPTPHALTAFPLLCPHCSSHKGVSPSTPSLRPSSPLCRVPGWDGHSRRGPTEPWRRRQRAEPGHKRAALYSPEPSCLVFSASLDREGGGHPSFVSAHPLSPAAPFEEPRLPALRREPCYFPASPAEARHVTPLQPVRAHRGGFWGAGAGRRREQVPWVWALLRLRSPEPPPALSEFGAVRQASFPFVNSLSV